jgi:hypothetical protein
MIRYIRDIAPAASISESSKPGFGDGNRGGHCGATPARWSKRTGRTVMAAKFEISKDKSGKFRVHLKAANGEIGAAASYRASSG